MLIIKSVTFDSYVKSDGNEGACTPLRNKLFKLSEHNQIVAVMIPKSSSGTLVAKFPVEPNIHSVRYLRKLR
jgi:hypothetical protein